MGCIALACRENAIAPLLQFSAPRISPRSGGTRGSVVESGHDIGIKHGYHSVKLAVAQRAEKESQKLVAAPFGWFWELLERPERGKKQAVLNPPPDGKSTFAGYP